MTMGNAISARPMKQSVTKLQAIPPPHASHWKAARTEVITIAPVSEIVARFIACILNLQ